MGLKDRKEGGKKANSGKDPKFYLVKRNQASKSVPASKMKFPSYPKELSYFGYCDTRSPLIASSTVTDWPSLFAP